MGFALFNILAQCRAYLKINNNPLGLAQAINFTTTQKNDR